MAQRKSSPVLVVVVATALVVTPLVLLGAYLGFYLGDLLGYSKSILAIILSTVGFLAAVAILSKAIVRIVARGGAKG